MATEAVRCGDDAFAVTIGAGAPVLIAGPCVIESRDHLFRHADALKAICEQTGFGFILKSSYDKANRTSGQSYRGPGIEGGLNILADARRAFEVPVLTDVHSESEVEQAADVVDIVQIPAFLCRQTDLLLAAGRCGKAVNIKKGQFVAPPDMKFAVDKVLETGNRSILLTERGTCFGYRDLIVDFRSLPQLALTGFPVVFDATHSVQQMGGDGGKSGGNRAFVPPLVRAAVSVGVDAIFLECHENPDQAPSDGPNMIPLSELAGLLAVARRLWEAAAELR